MKLLGNSLFFEIKRLGLVFLDYIYPKNCLDCKKEGFWLCGDCLKSQLAKNNYSCWYCGGSEVYPGICLNCSIKYNLNGVYILTDYDNKLIREAVIKVKYSYLKDIAADLSGILAFYKDLNLISDNVKGGRLIPVPLFRKREKSRGFNQSRLLAEGFKEILGLKVNDRVLKRVSFIRPQVGLSFPERLKNIKGCYKVDKVELANDSFKKAVLVDDVFTTGATIAECSRVLKEAGFSEIYAIILAKG